MNTADLVILAVLAIVVVFALRRIVKMRKNGCSCCSSGCGCTGNCASCGMGCSHKDKSSPDRC
jgi:hypothetical protein